ncbi:Chaperone modulatory protein CbpM [Carnimonas sp. R-84981]|uniref:chaperone modulator CbpM n=1 Tax=Carnimonas bestiolae TaxID=3402172 RepID=UPI003EDBEB8B
MTSVNCFDFDELCLRTSVPGETLITIVEHGIITPINTAAPRWQFDISTVWVVRRVVRLQRELELDWQGAALALELLDENQRLRDENERLQQRLLRFVEAL